MNKSVFISTLASFIILVFSCTEKEEKQPTLETIVDEFAPLQCRAIALREQRFTLANQIRFTQDTLTITASKKDIERLKSKLNGLNEQKNKTTQQSILLADSIKYTLDSLMSHYLTTKENKDQFNELLHTSLTKMNCTDNL